MCSLFYTIYAFFSTAQKSEAFAWLVYLWCYLLVRDSVSAENVRIALISALKNTEEANEMFGASRKECGNYRELSLDAAKVECARYRTVLESKLQKTFTYGE